MKYSDMYVEHHDVGAAEACDKLDAFAEALKNGTGREKYCAVQELIDAKNKGMQGLSLIHI